MKLLTERVLIREVAQRWKEQYAGYLGLSKGDTEEKAAIGRKLAALDGETATAADVAEIIGNDSWTRIDHCDECGTENIPAAVRLAEDTERTADICLPCLRAAVRLARGVQGASPTALERFNRDPDLLANETPLERLRYFLSLALNGQDWQDVEPFLDALGVDLPEGAQERAEFEAWHTGKYGRSYSEWVEAKGRYAWDLTEELWTAWKAARAHGVSVVDQQTFSQQTPMDSGKAEKQSE